jgi:hypothetical protein
MADDVFDVCAAEHLSGTVVPGALYQTRWVRRVLEHSTYITHLGRLEQQTSLSPTMIHHWLRELPFPSSPSQCFSPTQEPSFQFIQRSAAETQLVELGRLRRDLSFRAGDVHG